MKGHCRFRRVKSSICYFAEVWVEVTMGGETVSIVNALPEDVDADEGEVNQHTAGSWVDAALDGVRDAVEHAKREGLLTRGCNVELIRLVGSFVDTRDDVVRCAAGLAAWEGFGCSDHPPEAEFDSQRWQLHFPANKGIQVQGASR